jgi:hypothetical protein
MATTVNIEQLRYPVGKFTPPADPDIHRIDDAQFNQWKQEIVQFPKLLRTTLESITEEQLAWRYRPEGWTIRQVVHHCADSHMNAFVRLKLMLTEDNPVIKPYAEERWAELVDVTETPVEHSLQILDGVHWRWSLLLNHLTTQERSRTYTHPQYGRVYRLDVMTALYAWHCRHHLAHIQQAFRLKITG